MGNARRSGRMVRAGCRVALLCGAIPVWLAHSVNDLGPNAGDPGRPESADPAFVEMAVIVGIGVAVTVYAVLLHVLRRRGTRS